MSRKRFATIKPRFWTRGTGRRLSKDGKLLASYLMAGPNGSYVGLYELSMREIQDHTAMTPDEVRSAMRELSDERFAFWDEEEEVVWVVNAVIHSTAPQWSPESGWRSSYLRSAESICAVLGDHPFVAMFWEKYKKNIQISPKKATSGGEGTPHPPTTLSPPCQEGTSYSLSSSYSEEEQEPCQKKEPPSRVVGAVPDDYSCSLDTAQQLRMAGVTDAKWIRSQERPFVAYYQGEGALKADWHAVFRSWCMRGWSRRSAKANGRSE